MTPRNRFHFVPRPFPLRLAIAMACACASSHAITWDTDPAAGIQPANGDWNTTAPNWSADGTTLVGWVDPAETAVFAGADGSYLVTVTENLTVKALTFNNSGYILEGDGTGQRIIDISSSGIDDIRLAAGTTTIFDSGLKVRTFSHRVGQPEGTNGGTLDVASDHIYEARGSASMNVDGLGTTINVYGTIDTVTGRLNLGNNKASTSPGTPVTDVTINIKDGGVVDADGNAAQLGYALNTNADPADIMGTIVVEDGGTGKFAQLRLGQFGTGRLEVQIGGTVTATSVVLGNGGPAVGILDLEGNLTASAINFNKPNSVGNFNGATLTAAGVDGNGLIYGTGGTLNIRNAGLTIDTNGFDVVVNRGLAHSAIPGDDSLDGGLIKTGAGTLVLAEDNTYTGTTDILEGTLQVGNGGTTGTVSGEVFNDGQLVFNRSDDVEVIDPVIGVGGLAHIGAGKLTLSVLADFTGDVSVTTGILELNEGDAIDDGARLTIDGTGTVALTQSETVDTLFFGPAPQAAGTWGATGSGADNIDDTRFSGPGVLTVSNSGIATVQIWDTDAAPGFQPLSGNWNTTDTNWTSDGVNLLAWDPNLPTTFGGEDTTATITLTEDLTTSRIGFERSGFTIIGDDPARVLTLSGGQINLGAGTTNSLGADLRVLRATNSLRLGQAAGDDAGSLDILAGGTVDVAGNDLIIEGNGTSVAVDGILQISAGKGRINLGSNQTGGTDVTLTVRDGGQVFIETDPDPATSSNLVQVGFAANTIVDPTAVKGTITVEDGGLFRIGTNGDRALRLGQFGTGILNIAPGGVFQAGVVALGNGGSASGTLNLSGTLEANIVRTAKPNSRANFDGGTLKVTGATGANILENNAGNTNVRNGGLTVDTNGLDSSITRALNHSTIVDDSPIDGGLTKNGTGTLSLTAANGYTGPTTVAEGTLELNNGNAIPDTNRLVIQGSATVTLTQSETVNTLFYDSNSDSEAPGTYGASGSGATNIDNARFSGPGVLTVLSSGSAGDYDTWLGLFTFAPGADTTPAGDADNDGLSNQDEYAFGLDPSNPASLNPITADLGKSTGMFSYTRRDPALTGLIYKVWTSTTLEELDWTEDTGATQSAGATDGNGNQTVDVTLSGLPLTDRQLFVRITAE